VSAGDKNDPYFRKWLKILVQDLGDPTYLRLSSAARGVLGDLERFSLRSSTPPGRFLYAEDEAMTLDDLMRGISPADVDQDAINRQCVVELQAQKWLGYAEEEGWWLPKWADRQDKSITEPEAARRRRESATRRKRESRANEGKPKLRVVRKGGKS
jgi:hypothetical protein